MTESPSHYAVTATAKPATSPTTPLDEALQAWREADYHKRMAQLALDHALDNVLALIQDRVEEGVTRCDTAYFKASLTSKLNRTIDRPAALALKAEQPDLYALVFAEEPSLNLKALRALELADAARYARVAQTLIVKPGKPSLKVEEIV